MPALWDAETRFFEFLGYDMSYIEFAGTLLNVASVVLVIRRNVLTWPVGIAAVVLFALLFYQVELYSDFVEQIYFVVSGLYGWWIWTRLPRRPAALAEPITRLSVRARITTAAVVASGTIALGTVMSNIDRLLPRLFPEPAAYPFPDAFTTMMSFVAQVLMAHRKLESWFLWIAVDVIGIWLYWVRDVRFISLLYVLFLVLAIRGLSTWRRDSSHQAKALGEAVPAPDAAAVYR